MQIGCFCKTQNLCSLFPRNFPTWYSNKTVHTSCWQDGMKQIVLYNFRKHIKKKIHPSKWSNCVITNGHPGKATVQWRRIKITRRGKVGLPNDKFYDREAHSAWPQSTKKQNWRINHLETSDLQKINLHVGKYCTWRFSCANYINNTRKYSLRFMWHLGLSAYNNPILP